jgi:hypothetical protein
VGRAGPIITARLKYALHVRLVAPFEFRATKYARSEGISEKEAARAIRANDEANHHYVRLYFNQNVSDPLQYDLVVNTGRNGFERAAHLICAGVEDLVPKSRAEDTILHSAESFGQSRRSKREPKLSTAKHRLPGPSSCGTQKVDPSRTKEALPFWQHFKESWTGGKLL